jgi:intracellular septation protein
VNETGNDGAAASTGELKPQLIKLSLEIGPLIVFFLANAYGGRVIEGFSLQAIFPQPIFFATAVFMVAMVIALGLSWSIMKRVAVMPLVSGVIVMIFGGLTLWLQDETFIKMKPTIVQVLFAAILLGGLALDRPLLKPLLGRMMPPMSDAAWRRFTLRYALFFIAMALLNELVWRTQSTDLWVTFKVFGLTGLTFLFILAQMPFITRESRLAGAASKPSAPGD